MGLEMMAVWAAHLRLGVTSMWSLQQRRDPVAKELSMLGSRPRADWGLRSERAEGPQRAGEAGCPPVECWQQAHHTARTWQRVLVCEFLVGWQVEERQAVFLPEAMAVKEGGYCQPPPSRPGAAEG